MPHYRNSARDCVQARLPEHNGSAEYPARFRHVTPPQNFTFGGIKNHVYARKSATVDQLKREIKFSLMAVSSATRRHACNALVLIAGVVNLCSFQGKFHTNKRLCII